MTKKTEEMILEQLFKLSNKVDKMQDIMATKDDLKNFATKDDLKNFATKDDLKKFATKDDLKNFATKDDLKNFATKDDLKQLEERINGKFATKDDLKQLEERSNKKLEQEIQGVAEIIQDAITRSEKIHKQMEANTDRKIQALRNEFIIYQETKTQNAI